MYFFIFKLSFCERGAREERASESPRVKLDIEERGVKRNHFVSFYDILVLIRSTGFIRHEVFSSRPSSKTLTCMKKKFTSSPRV